MARQDIRAGKAFVELTLKNSAFLRGLRTSGQRLKNFGGGMMRIGAGITAMGAAITAPLIAAAKHFASAGDQLDKMSNRTGVSVEALSELKFAAEQTGANVDILEKGFAGLSRTFFEAKRGAAVAVDALAELGLTFQDLDGLSPDQQLELIADGLTRISNESIRGAVAQKIFGRAGRQLLPLLKGAKGGIRELREEARRLGLTIGTEDATAAARLTDAMNRMRRVVTTTFFNIGAAIGGKLADGLDVIQGYVSGISKWVKANREIFVTVIKVGGAIVAAGIAVTSLGLAIKLAGFALSGFATALAVVKGLLLFIVSPIGLITAALGAGIVLWAKYTESGQRAVGAISNVMRQIFQTVSTTFGGIKDAISGGDLALAGRIAMAGLRVVFLHGLSAISSIFGNFTARFAKMLFSGDFAGAWDLAIKGMAKLWHEFAEGVVAVFTGAARLAVEAWRRSFNAIAGYLFRLSQQGGAGGKIASTILGVDLAAEQKRTVERRPQDIAQKERHLSDREADLARARAEGDIESVRMKISEDGIITRFIVKETADEVAADVEQIRQRLEELRTTPVDLASEILGNFQAETGNIANDLTDWIGKLDSVMQARTRDATERVTKITKGASEEIVDSIDAAQAELDALREEAARLAAEARKRDEERAGMLGGAGAEIGDAESMRRKTFVTFSAAAAQAQGQGGSPQVRELKNIDKKMERLLKIDENLLQEARLGGAIA